MAAGQGFKTFTSGEVLTAADVNGYLMQGVGVFTDAANRDAEITSPQEGQFAYLKDSDATTYYTGSEWANSGGLTYATYTPTFTGFTKGNATIVARYAQSGKSVNVFVEVTLGSTSLITGSLTISLPVTAATNALGSRGIGACSDSGVRAYSAVSILNSTTAMEIKPLAASLSFVAEDDVSAAQPMTWTTNDKFSTNITYEAA
jgi:hypothetical protein